MIQRRRDKIPMTEVMRFFLEQPDSIGAYNCYDEAIVVITPELEFTYGVDILYHHAIIKDRQIHEYDKLIPEVHSYMPIGFKRTELITEGAYMYPWRLYLDLETNTFSDDIPELINADFNPPNSLFLEMNKAGAKYAYVDSSTGNPVFIK